MALCSIMKRSNHNDTFGHEKFVATTGEQILHSNGKLPRYASRKNSPWRLHRVNPPGNFYKVTRHDCCPSGSKFENKIVNILYFDLIDTPAIRFYKYHNQIFGDNKEQFVY